MFEWLYNLTKEQKNEWMQTIIEDMVSPDSIYASHVVKTFNIEDVEVALKYSIDHASEGKVILRAFE